MRGYLNSLLLAGAFALTACGGKGGGDSEAIKAYKGIAKAVCECKDAECAAKVDQQEQDWRMENFKGLSAGDKDKMKNARQDFQKCRDKLKGGE